ncbi:MAG: hypothetical protein QQN41_10375 [Nitrosopumilus sp.]
MSETIKELCKPLNKDEVELRIGNTNQSGFSLLAYKTSRTDVKRLNDVFGINWKNKHYYDDKDNICCEILVKEAEEWIGRSDVGKESYTEKEKGSYSDSFKRAGYRWGIGIELYKSPFIWVRWAMKKTEKSGKVKYSPVDFYQSNLSITEYKVENGVPAFEIRYNASIIFSNIGGKKISQNPDRFDNEKDDFRMTEEQRKKLTTYITKIDSDAGIRLNQWLKKPHTKQEAEETLLHCQTLAGEIN